MENKTNYYLINFDTRSGRAEVQRFKSESRATRAYEMLERRYRNSSQREIVLAGADSLDTLKRTHGRYFHEKNRKVLHVVRSGASWGVKKEGSSRAIGKFSSKNKAVADARRVASKVGGRVIVHDRDGRIRSAITVGRDPFATYAADHERKSEIASSEVIRDGRILK